MRVLLVEDDEGVAAAVCTALRQHRVEFDHVRRGCDALAHVVACDVVVLDLGLPDTDGLEVCRQLRACRPVPIIMATARGELRDRILGLDHGADDYLVKPFHVDELIARIRAVLRRESSAPALRVSAVAGMEIDVDACRVTVDGVDVALGPKEFRLLATIAEAGGAVCTRRRLVAEIWGRWWSGADRTLDVNIATIRRKTGRPKVIETVRGIGYRLVDPESPEGRR